MLLCETFIKNFIKLADIFLVRLINFWYNNVNLVFLSLGFVQVVFNNYARCIILEKFLWEIGY